MARRCFEDGSLDLVYIDADHKCLFSKERGVHLEHAFLLARLRMECFGARWWSVLQDLSAWWPKVRPGGLMKLGEG